MTNERLAELIQEGGNDELLSQLWENTYRLIYKKCGQIWRSYSERLTQYGYSLDDLRQESYNALIFAVKGYKSEKGYKFTSYLNYALKSVIRVLLSGGSDVLNQAGTMSLAQPLGEGKDGELLLVGDTVPYERAAAVYEDIERLDEYNILYEAIDSLSDVERRVIIEYYFKGYSFKQIGRLHGFSKMRAKAAHDRALWLLRRGRIGRKLWEVYGEELGCCFNGTITDKNNISLNIRRKTRERMLDET